MSQIKELRDAGAEKIFRENSEAEPKATRRSRQLSALRRSAALWQFSAQASDIVGLRVSCGGGAVVSPYVPPSHREGARGRFSLGAFCFFLLAGPFLFPG